MDTEKLETKVKGWFSKGAKASKKAFETVGEKVQDFTDKSVVKIEKKQLLGKLEAKYSELGRKMYELLDSDNGDDLFDIKNDDNKKLIENLQSEIKTLLLQIEEKEKEINC